MGVLASFDGGGEFGGDAAIAGGLVCLLGAADDAADCGQGVDQGVVFQLLEGIAGDAELPGDGGLGGSLSPGFSWPLMIRSRIIFAISWRLFCNVDIRSCNKVVPGGEPGTMPRVGGSAPGILSSASGGSWLR